MFNFDMLLYQDLRMCLDSCWGMVLSMCWHKVIDRLSLYVPVLVGFCNAMVILCAGRCSVGNASTYKLLNQCLCYFIYELT
jgi:hypothetical protein